MPPRVHTFFQSLRLHLLLAIPLFVAWRRRKRPRRLRGAFTKEQRIQCRKLLRTHPCYTNAMVAYTNGLTTRLVGEGSIPNDGEGHYDGRLRMAFHDQCANGRKRTIARRRALVSAAAAAHAHFRSPLVRWAFVHLNNERMALPKLSHHQQIAAFAQAA